MIHGVDLSAFQPRVDYRQLRIDGFQFAYARACEGLSTDPTHLHHIVAARLAGIAIGSYGVGHPSQDVVKLAEYFISLADVTELRPVLDIETLSNNHVPENAGEWSDNFCELVKAGTGQEPIIYSSSSYWLTMCAQRPQIGGPFGWDLWVAVYRSGVGVTNLDDLKHPPHMPFVAWQFAGNVPLANQVGMWDRDIVLEDSFDRLRVK